MTDDFDARSRGLTKRTRGALLMARRAWGWCRAASSFFQGGVRKAWPPTLILILMNVGATAPAVGATVTNLDTAPQVLLVTEGGTRLELMVPASESIEFCSEGCFVTFPNGDKQALSGSEIIELSGGGAKFK
jgi:hypothetical protein